MHFLSFRYYSTYIPLIKLYIEISEKIIQLIPNAITEFVPRDIKYTIFIINYEYEYI